MGARAWRSRRYKFSNAQAKRAARRWDRRKRGLVKF